MRCTGMWSDQPAMQRKSAQSLALLTGARHAAGFATTPVDEGERLCRVDRDAEQIALPLVAALSPQHHLLLAVATPSAVIVAPKPEPRPISA